MKNLFTILVGLLLWSSTYSQDPLWQFSITSNDIDFIKSDDPDDFQSVAYLGTRNRVEMPSKEKSGLFEDGVHIFEATFATGKVLEIRVSGDLGNETQARTWVDKLTPRLGKLPVQNRQNLNHVNIHQGGPNTSANAENKGRFFNLYSQNMDVRISNNDLEETVFHESVHAGYQEDYQETAEWQNAVSSDNAYITEYARDRTLNGVKIEDMPEHAIFCYTYLKYPGRLPANVEDFVINYLQHRTAFFRDVIGYPDNTGGSNTGGSNTGGSNDGGSNNDGGNDGDESNSERLIGFDNLGDRTTTSANRRAMPVVMPEDGTITSVSMYHEAGQGDMRLAIYNGNGTNPNNRIAVTDVTAVSSQTGWQTIQLQQPVQVNANETLFLAWVYENNPGIRYRQGSPGRIDAGSGWSSGMPSNWGGTANQSDWVYNIYANYTPSSDSNNNGGGNSGGSSTSARIGYENLGDRVSAAASNRRAMPIDMPSDGQITSISMYHEGGNNAMRLAVYDGSGTTPQNRLGMTPVTPVNNSAGWQTINLEQPVSVSANQRLFLAWVYEDSVEVRYYAGTPGRIDSTQGWSDGIMPSFWQGNTFQTNWVYNIYANYTTTSLKSSSKKGIHDNASIIDNRLKNNITIQSSLVKNNLTFVNNNNITVRKITVYDITGKVVRLINLPQSNSLIKVDVSSLGTGIYFANLSSANDNLKFKWVKN